MRVRGLKLKSVERKHIQAKVAPHAGAWIETVSIRNHRAGSFQSHPMRVRGLKRLME